MYAYIFKRLNYHYFVKTEHLNLSDYIPTENIFNDTKTNIPNILVNDLWLNQKKLLVDACITYILLLILDFLIFVFNKI